MIYNTLEHFADREIALLKELLTNYNNAGTSGLNELPNSWIDEAVTIGFDTISGEVFLTNKFHQKLINTEHGVAMEYDIPENALSGTLIDLCNRYDDSWSIADSNELLNIILIDGDNVANDEQENLIKNTANDIVFNIIDLSKDSIFEVLNKVINNQDWYEYEDGILLDQVSRVLK